MLKSLIGHRPSQLLAVYIEPQRVEVLRARRQWRAWHIDSAERFTLPEGESLFDYLQRLNLRFKGRKGTALILFLPRLYYTFHKEHYPAALGEQLDEALNFDWQENVFHESEQTLRFFGPSVPVDHHLSVPIFSLQQDTYDKFYQILGGSSFQTFTVIPSALIYKAFLNTLPVQGNASEIEILGRAVDHDHLEINRFYRGALVDSTLVDRNPNHLRLFREHLQCIGNGAEEGAPHEEAASVHLLCGDEHCDREDTAQWLGNGLPVRAHSVQEPFIVHWMRYLFDQDRIQTFDAPLLLKPWTIPAVTWPLLILAGLYLAFAAYQVHSYRQIEDSTRRLKRQITHLESQWKPIETFQTRISKFEEDQKTLSQFDAQGYPLLDILSMLSQVTPEDTWINYLSLRKGQLVLRGESKSALKYLSEVSKVDGFGDVRFASPVSRNPASNMERFNLQLQVDLEKLKKTLSSMPEEKSEERLDAEVLRVPPQPSQPVVQQPAPQAQEQEPEEEQEEEPIEEELPEVEEGEDEG